MTAAIEKDKRPPGVVLAEILAGELDIDLCPHVLKRTEKIIMLLWLHGWRIVRHEDVEAEDDE